MAAARAIPKKHLVEKETSDAYKVHTTGDRELLSNQKFMHKFLSFIDNTKLIEYTTRDGKYTFKRLLGYKSDTKHLQRSYIIEIKDRNNSVHKYFVKEEKVGDFSSFSKSNRLYNWEDAKTESKALKIISDYLKFAKKKGIDEQGIELVPLKFAILYKKENKSLVCYDYQDLHRLTTLQTKKQLSAVDFLDYNKKLRFFEDRVNGYLKENYEKYGLEPGTEVTDISPHFTFFDPKTKKLKIFNPVLLK